MQELAQEQALLIQAGSTFESLIAHPGWKLVMSIFKRYEDNTQKDLFSYMGSDPNVIKAKLMAVRAVLEVRQSMEFEIATAIEGYKKALKLAESEEINYE